MEGLRDPRVVVRHLDDVKECRSELVINPTVNDPIPVEDVPFSHAEDAASDALLEPDEVEIELPDVPRRSTRDRSAPVRYPEGEWST